MLLYTGLVCYTRHLPRRNWCDVVLREENTDEEQASTDRRLLGYLFVCLHSFVYRLGSRFNDCLQVSCRISLAMPAFYCVLHRMLEYRGGLEPCNTHRTHAPCESVIYSVKHNQVISGARLDRGDTEYCSPRRPCREL